MKKVRTIPAIINKYDRSPISAVKKRKVAGYARVSTDAAEQLTSYEAQVDYYTNHIKNNENWEFVKVYTDEGITATSTKKREGFKRMVADALAGKIDLILTKSVSRFARNTVDSLSTIRLLKEHGTEVYFEKENIWTFDSKGELLLTIMSSLAQEESRSISENCIWGQRKRFADGRGSLAYSRFLGYEKGKNGEMVINEEQAEVVRRIFRMYLQGYTTVSIAKILTEEGVKTATGITRWSNSSVKSILSNEKYKGDALLQKSYIADFLTKKPKKNNGEVPQYYVTNSHPAIIEPEIFDKVQRMKEKTTRAGKNEFKNRIICGDCGAFFGSKVWHSTSSYKKTIWRCNEKYKGTKCKTPHLEVDELKALFVKAINKILESKAVIIESFSSDLYNVEQEKKEVEILEEKLNEVVEKINDYVKGNMKKANDQTAYQIKYGKMVSEYEGIKEKIDKLNEIILEKESNKDEMDLFISNLEPHELVDEYDEELFRTTVEKIYVYSNGAVRFCFINGDKVDM